jgi:glycosyltransferase involved in cell wall biosynthesis
MRILLLAPHPFYVDRGTPIDVDILLRALSARGETVDVVTYGGGEDRVYPGVTLYRAPIPSCLGAIGPGFSLKKLIADCWLFAKARRLVATHKYDVIHANEEAVFLAMWFKFRNGLQYVYDMDSSIAQQLVEKKAFLKPGTFLFNWCEAKAIRSSLAAAPVCNALAELAQKRGARHVTTLHDISQLTAADFAAAGSLREELGLGGIVVMYVGNLEAYQGIDLLLESFVQVTPQVDCDLVVAGGTPESIRTYREKARRLGIDRQTHFIGPWPANRLGELLSQADILVAPRIRGINTPMKVFPYMHSGGAVLVTALPTHTQILNNSVCELAPPDPKSFADAIIRLARDEERRQKLGAAGRQFVQTHHTFPAHQQRVDELYSYVEAELNLMASTPACIVQQIEHGLNTPLQTKHKETLV